MAAALARSAAQLTEDCDALDAIAAAEAWRIELAPAAGEALDGSDHAVSVMHTDGLAELAPAIRSRVLRQAALAAGCPAGSLAAGHIAALDALVTGWHGQRWADLPGVIPPGAGMGSCSSARAGQPGWGRRNRLRRRQRVDASDVGTDLKEVLIPAERLQARVTELAAQIDRDYACRELLLVGVLKGAVMIMADLARAMHLPVQMDWMAVSSYGSGTRSSGVVRILKDLDNDITGKDVLVVEDIVDSGLTLSWLVGNLRSRGPPRCGYASCCVNRPPRGWTWTWPTPVSTSRTSS